MAYVRIPKGCTKVPLHSAPPPLPSTTVTPCLPETAGPRSGPAARAAVVGRPTALSKALPGRQQTAHNGGSHITHSARL